MKHKLSLFAVLLMALAIPQTVIATGFPVIAPSGQTLYYVVTGSTATVTFPSNYPYPSNTPWEGYTKPTGALIIPESVSISGTTYSVTSISDYAFYECSGITSITIPSSIISIGDLAFSSCDNLNTFNINCDSLGSVGMQDIRSSVATQLTVSVLNVGRNVRYFPNDMSMLELSGGTGFDTVNFNADSCVCAHSLGGQYAITIGNHVKNIPEGAFACASNYIPVTIVVPDSVRRIGSYAFQGRGIINKLVIGKNVSYIGYNSSMCDIDSLVFNADSCVYNGGIAADVVIVGNNVKYFPGGVGLAGLNRHPSTVVIGQSVRRIGGTINGYYEVMFNADSCTYSAGIQACRLIFGNDVRHIPAGFSSSYSTWYDDQLTIGRSVKHIASGAFANFVNITYNADSCLSMGTSSAPAFCSDNNAMERTYGETFSIGSNVKCIPDYAFKGLSSVQYISIPDSVRRIGTQSFYNVSSYYGDIFIGRSVETLGNNAFYNCISNSSGTIHSYNSVAPTIDNSFTGIPTNVEVYIPCGSLQSYQTRWSRFNTFIESYAPSFYLTNPITPAGILEIITQPTCSNRLAQVRATANAGYQFDHWSDGSRENPHTVNTDTISSITGSFIEAASSDTVVVHDTIYITILDTLTLHDTITNIVHDTVSTIVHDTVTNIVHDTITNIVHDTVSTIVHDTVTNIVHDTVTNIVHDTVSTIVHDTVTTIVHDTVTNTIRDTLIVTDIDTVVVNNYDTIYIDYTDTIFIYDTVYIHDTVYVGIDDIQTVEARIYQREGQIVVELDEGSEPLDVRVYDAVGRLLATRNSEGVHGGTPLRFDIPTAGVYLVRIGDRPARKVVVMR